MAESPLDRLKRLAAEKKAAVTPVTQPVVSDVVAETASGEAGASEQLKETEDLVTKLEEAVQEVRESHGEVDTKLAVLSMQIASADKEVTELIAAVTPKPKPEPLSDHPLAMQFAELESALLATDPEFKTILRQIHKHLGNEPELVTQMTEKEIQMVVQGLIVFANAEIVAPAAAKSQAKKVKEAKTKVISADDL